MKNPIFVSTKQRAPVFTLADLGKLNTEDALFQACGKKRNFCIRLGIAVFRRFVSIIKKSEMCVGDPLIIPPAPGNGERMTTATTKRPPQNRKEGASKQQTGVYWYINGRFFPRLTKYIHFKTKKGSESLS